MSVRRALVDCVVLSLKDTHVFYPCCKVCFSKTDVEQEDTTRSRCFKCGFSCLREQVGYRYRLSLRVARDRCIFGVSVFGNCLNPFFGIDASGLQRLVENFDGPVGASTRSTLLSKAVEDCFIGRHFIFGIKINKEGVPWSGGPFANGSSSNETVHFIASQMILPKAMGLGGCTVVSYYRILLQKAEENELDPRKTSQLPTLLVFPHHSPASSFNNGTLSTSGLLSQSLQRSLYQDHTLTPTPPWQQSLGLITSSAEQEESFSTQDSGHDKNRQRDSSKTPNHPQRACQNNHSETVLSPFLSLECSPSSAKYPYSFGNTPILEKWFSPSPPPHSSFKAESFPTKELTKTSLSNSLEWDNLPFSESLTEFLCEENKVFDNVSGTESHQNQKETIGKNLEIRSEGNNLSSESSAVNSETTDGDSQILLDVTNTPAPKVGDRHDLSDQMCKGPVGCVNKNQTINIRSHESNQEDEKAGSLSFENGGEEQVERDTYNCSADLFSDSVTVEMNTNSLNMQAETDRMTTEGCPVFFKPDKRYPRSEKDIIPQSTPHKEKLKTNECINRKNLFPPGTQELDFIPPSQSTPILKAPVVSHSTLPLGDFSSQPDSQCPVRNLPQWDCESPAQITSSHCKLNCVSGSLPPWCGGGSAKENLVRCTPSSRYSHRFIQKRRFWKPVKSQKYLPAEQRYGVQRGAVNTPSPGGIIHKCDSSDGDVTVCDYEDSEVIIVPPTPAARTLLSMKPGRRRQTDNSRGHLDHTWEKQQRDGVNCRRTLLGQSCTSSQRALAQTGNCEGETVVAGSLDESNCCPPDGENEACDWSRDLFSDSV